MDTAGAMDRDGSALDYCRLNEIMIQAWSPFQKPGWKGAFIGDDEYDELNKALNELADQYGVTPTAIASAWDRTTRIDSFKYVCFPEEYTDTIEAPNTLSAKGRSVTVKYKKLKKKAQTVKAINVKSPPKSKSSERPTH